MCKFYICAVVGVIIEWLLPVFRGWRAWWPCNKCRLNLMKANLICKTMIWIRRIRVLDSLWMVECVRIPACLKWPCYQAFWVDQLASCSWSFWAQVDIWLPEMYYRNWGGGGDTCALQNLDHNFLYIYTWVRASWIEFNNCPTRCDLFSLLHFCRQLYMFQV